MRALKAWWWLLPFGVSGLVWWIFGPDTPQDAGGGRTPAETPPAAAAAVPSRPIPVMRAPDRIRLLERDLQALIPRWRSAEWGILVTSLDYGDTLFAHNAQALLTPASNVKLITTVAALHFLGPDFRYETFLLRDGPIQDGHLRGNLVLYGTGDPGIGDRFFRSETEVFEAFADALIEEGVTVIEGDIIGDGSFFSGPDLAPGWDPLDLNDWFAAPVSGLGYNENILTLRVAPAATIGVPPTVETFPDLPLLTFNNHAETVAGRPRPFLWIDRKTPSSAIRVEGEMQSGGRDAWREMTILDGPLYAASALAEVITARGIRVVGAPRSIRETVEGSTVTRKMAWSSPDQRAEIISVHTSPPLLEYLNVMNRLSHNFYAESILKTIGRVANGDGSFTGGAAAIRDFLASEAGISPAQLRPVDGSGLAEGNRASAAGFVQLLSYAAGSSTWEQFWSALPEAGRRSGLNRMYRTPAARNLRAKTGTIDGVSALSGMVRSATGERLLFSILSNGVGSTSAAKGVENRIGARLASFDRPFTPPPDGADSTTTPPEG